MSDFIEERLLEIDSANENKARLDRFFMKMDLVPRHFKPLEEGINLHVCPTQEVLAINNENIEDDYQDYGVTGLE